MRIYKFLFCLCILIFYEQKVAGQVNLPSSLDGIGIPYESLPSHLVSAPGVVMISDMMGINYINPASYGSYSKIRFDIGLQVKNTTYNHVANNFQNSFSSIDFSNLHLGIPLKKNKLSLVIGFLPYTQIGLNLFYSAPVNRSSTTDTASHVLKGEGGSYLLHTGLGYHLNDYISVGVNIGYLWGRKNISSTITAKGQGTSTYSSSSDSRRLFFGGIQTTVGLLASVPLSQKLLLRLGAGLSFPVRTTSTLDVLRGSFNRSQQTVGLIDTIENARITNITPVTIPGNYRISLGLTNPSRSLTIGIEYSSTQWSQFAIEQRIENGLFRLDNDWKLSFGVRAQPNKTVINTQTNNIESTPSVAYSLGGFYSKAHLNEEDGGIVPRYGFSLGVQLPIKRHSYSNQFGSINLAVLYTVQGSIENNTFPHNTLTVQIGFSLGDIWFLKRKYR